MLWIAFKTKIRTQDVQCSGNDKKHQTFMKYFYCNFDQQICGLKRNQNFAKNSGNHGKEFFNTLAKAYY